MKIMGIDLGQARTGVCVSDLSGFLAGRSITIAQHNRDKLLEEICRELGRGAIAADPFWRGPDKNACRYCDYAAACHFEEGRGGDCRRWAHKLAAADFWTEVDGGKKHD